MQQWLIPFAGSTMRIRWLPPVGGGRSATRSGVAARFAKIPAVTLPAAEPAPELATIADLPFHVSGRYPKPLLVGQVRDGHVGGEYRKEWIERLRDLSLGLRVV